jgi:hypothetical protein
MSSTVSPNSPEGAWSIEITGETPHPQFFANSIISKQLLQSTVFPNQTSVYCITNATLNSLLKTIQKRHRSWIERPIRHVGQKSSFCEFLTYFITNLTVLTRSQAVLESYQLWRFEYMTKGDRSGNTVLWEESKRVFSLSNLIKVIVRPIIYCSMVNSS